KRLREIIANHRHVFRLRLGSTPPAKVPPMIIRLRDDSLPVKVKARRYAPRQREFVNTFIARLLACGMAEERPTATW
ncbi:MAG: hypothetical protein AAF417_23100, partial [Pseudomonadota bacterium]